jgi:hypothetical protein
MDWMLNEDGVFYFAEKTLPRIRKQVPNIFLRKKNSGRVRNE